MSDEHDPASDDDGEQRISVSRTAPIRELPSSRIVRAVRLTLGERPVTALSVALIDDATMTSLHERSLGDPTPTDVLSFDLRDNEDDERVEGEVVVSVETARRQASRLGEDVGRELLRYVIHGVLHLTGRDDRTPSQRRAMRREEDRVLRALDRPANGSGRTHPRERTAKGG